MEQFVLLLRTGRRQRLSEDLQKLCAKHGLPENVPFRYMSGTDELAAFAQSEEARPVLVIATGELKQFNPGMVVNARKRITELAAHWGSALEFVPDAD